jgi:quercetin dioxygenase-like cupin family protein
MRVTRVSEVKATEVMKGFHGRFIHSENMTFAYWQIEAGSELPAHAHPHEQVANVLEGAFELCVDGEAATLEAGSVAVIPSNATHTGRAISDCRILDVFHPVRDDYRL